MVESAFAEHIMQNLFNTDFHKLTMIQAVLRNYLDAEVEREFCCRNVRDLCPCLAKIRYRIEYLAEVEVTVDQFVFLERILFMKSNFIRSPSLFRFNLHRMHTGIEDDQLTTRLHGSWLHVILSEMPLLAIVNEMHNRHRYREVVLEQTSKQLYRKLDWLSVQANNEEFTEFQVANFGTHRHFSYRTQEEVAHTLEHDFFGHFIGINSVHLVREYDLKLIGITAHE